MDNHISISYLIDVLRYHIWKYNLSKCKVMTSLQTLDKPYSEEVMRLFRNII